MSICQANLITLKEYQSTNFNGKRKHEPLKANSRGKYETKSSPQKLILPASGNWHILKTKPKGASKEIFFKKKKKLYLSFHWTNVIL